MTPNFPGRFSIVTPNFNMGAMLCETMRSVLANLQPGDEYFVIDGASTDNSLSVIRSFESQLSGWTSEPDSGYQEALTKGFKRCTGDFLCWVNSSDLLLKGSLDHARKVLMESDADLIFGDDLYIDENSRVISHSHGAVSSLRNAMLYGGWTPLQDACFWRRSLYERLGGIDPTIQHAADYDLFLRAACSGRCLYTSIIFSAFRRHAQQKSISGMEKYESERRAARLRALMASRVPGYKRMLMEAYYFSSIRWRHHVARRFWRQAVPAGTLARELPSMRMKA